MNNILYICAWKGITHFRTVKFCKIIFYAICPSAENPPRRIPYFFHQIPSRTAQPSGEPLLIFSAPKQQCPAHDHVLIKTPPTTWNRTYRTKMEWLKHFIGPLSHIRCPIRGNRSRLPGSRIPIVSFTSGANTKVRLLFPTRYVGKKSMYEMNDKLVGRSDLDVELDLSVRDITTMSKWQPPKPHKRSCDSSHTNWN